MATMRTRRCERIRTRFRREEQFLDIRLPPLLPNRRHRSIGTSTAVSTPRLVTICGPSARLLSSNSLNRALAACTCQVLLTWPSSRTMMTSYLTSYTSIVPKPHPRQGATLPRYHPDHACGTDRLPGRRQDHRRPAGGRAARMGVPGRRPRHRGALPAHPHGDLPAPRRALLPRRGELGGGRAVRPRRRRGHVWRRHPHAPRQPGARPPRTACWSIWRRMPRSCGGGSRRIRRAPPRARTWPAAACRRW